VLPAGQVPPNPSELLGSRTMASLLEHLASQYDIAGMDTPPLLPVLAAARRSNRPAAAHPPDEAALDKRLHGLRLEVDRDQWP